MSPEPPEAPTALEADGADGGEAVEPAGPPRRRAFGAARAYLVLLAVFFVGTRLLAEGAWWSALLLYLPQGLLLAPLPVLFLWAALARDAGALALNGACLLLVLGPLMEGNVPLPRFPPPADAPRVRLLTYNIKGALSGYDAVLAQVDRYQPDVVVFQEALGWADDTRTRQVLAERFAGWALVYSGDVCIASRWPLAGQETRFVGPRRVKYSGDPRKALRVWVQAPFGRFQVIGTHFYTAMGAASLRREWRNLPGYIGGTLRARREQAEELSEWLRPGAEPLLLAGDFNTPPRGRVYGLLRRSLGDCFADSAWGWGYTYPSRFPLLRIDYLFRSRHWQTVRCEVGGEAGSDHRPVFAELALRS
jgi:vancomycin resistance protein VanJ